MKEATGCFLGTHDWTAYSAAQSDAETRVRTITEFTVETRWDSRAQAQIIEFYITADGFLRYMVRSIVGTVLEAGRGEKDFDTIQTAIKSGDRRLAGATAPAKGLTLLKVYY
jgi:tRNA pseudouridine38-40 synthase